MDMNVEKTPRIGEGRLKVLAAGVLIVLVMLPRVLGLGVFVGPDEMMWVARSCEFARALAAGDLEQTYRSGHPGVTLLWAETVGFAIRKGASHLGGEPLSWQEVTDGDNSMSNLHRFRLVSAALNGILALFAIWMVYGVFGGRVAFVAGVLIALDPFPLTEARALRTEGLLMGFGTLVVFAVFIYLKEKKRAWLVVCGVLAGLGLLSKVSSVSVLPVLALVPLAVELWRGEEPVRSRLRRAVVSTLAWFVPLLLTVFILWPALWVAPGHVFEQMSGYVGLRAVEGGGGGEHFYFLGEEISRDPGPLFYPVALLYRSSPFTMLGLMLAVAVFALRRGETSPPCPRATLPVIALYLAVHLSLITFSRLKFDRYLIPVFPALSLLAACGFVWGADAWLRGAWRRAALAALVVLQLALTLPHHPYYYTYWNPLTGGIKGAMKVLPVGTGTEGVDVAASYLNSLPDAGDIRLASAVSGKIGPLFVGQTIPMDNLDGRWVQGDYVFIYISQLQRGKHNPGIIEYVQGRKKVYTVVLAGMEYGWIYEGPAAEYYGGGDVLEGYGALWGYDPDTRNLRGGDTLRVKLYWQSRSPIAGECMEGRLYVRLLDSDGYTWADAAAVPEPGFADAVCMRESVVESMAALELHAGMPPGAYYLKAGFEGRDGSNVGEFRLPAGDDTIEVQPPDVFPPLEKAELPYPLGLSLGELELAGYDVSSSELRHGETAWFTFYWHASGDVSRDYVIALRLLDGAGEESIYWLGRPVRSGYPTDTWRKGQIVQDGWKLYFPDEAEPGEYTLQVLVYDAADGEEVARRDLRKIRLAADE